uniref:MFS domain-containing protein n=2 Tax=Steinernema glaseri TaxID=37863 RepID=A0A1I8AAU6_9BILA
MSSRVVPSDDEEGTTESYEITTPEDVLQALGKWNPFLIYITVSMALIWGLTAMPIMVSAFIIDGVTCSTNDSSCMEEKARMVDVKDEFHVLEENFLSPEWVSSSFFVGNMIGGTLLSYMADRIGRRIIVVPSLFCLGLFGMFATFSTSFPILLLARFFQGFFFTSSSMVNWVLACESISIQAHAHASMLFGLCWVVGYCVVAPIAFWFANWRWIMFCASVPSVVFACIFWFTIPESFLFLIEKRRRNEVVKWIRKAERPGRPVPFDVDKVLSHRRDDADVHLDDSLESTTHDQLIPFLVNNSIYILYLVIAAYMWITDFLVYNGMSLFSTTLVGNPYMNYILSGLVELPAYLITPELLNRFGRRNTVIISHLFTGICLTSLYLVPQGWATLYISIWLSGKLATSMSFMCLFVYGSEIFPTAVRNSCMGICSMVSNLGAVLAPHVKHLAHIHPILPVISMGAMSLISAALALLLPETIHVHPTY